MGTEDVEVGRTSESAVRTVEVRVSLPGGGGPHVGIRGLKHAIGETQIEIGGTRFRDRGPRREIGGPTSEDRWLQREIHGPVHDTGGPTLEAA